ncbi:MAG: hypothetical protein IPM39_21235 [Chloroflexi bacterium]|nr:hypothetical protein [Chloroflexota bacterium]
MRRQPGMLFWLALLLAAGLLSGCANSATPDANEQAVGALLPRPPVTLQPTFTPQPTAGPLPTITPPPARPTAVPNTPIPFGDTAVELRYQIPALGLDRRLQGSIAAEIITVDEATGAARKRTNQAGIMLELNSALPQMDLAPLPEGCDTCVYVEYSLPNQGLSGAGWLQDSVLLASIENYLTAALGPHFPPDTIVGLRRSASPYAPTHSIALTSDGRVWTWLATEPQISPPTPENPPILPLERLTDQSPAGWQSEYTVECLGSPLETLAVTYGETTWQGLITCPELALPDTLLPLYLWLDERLAAKIEPSALPQPDRLFPLDALVQYRRADGARLTLLADGALIGVDTAGVVFTGTLTATSPISLTTTLVKSNLLQPGLRTFNTSQTATSPQTVLVVRGPTGLLDGQWTTLPDNAIFATLDALWADLIGLPEARETAVPPATIAPSPTP